VATAQLGGLDPDGDTVSYQVVVPPTSSLIGRLTLSSTGILSASNICSTCTGVVQVIYSTVHAGVVRNSIVGILCGCGLDIVYIVLHRCCICTGTL